MGADAQKAAARFGGALIAGDDPTLQDAAQAGVAHAYQLLFVMAGRSGGQSYSTRSIQVSAFDSGLDPDITSAVEFLKSSVKVLQRLKAPLQPVGPPVEMSLGGRRVWRMDLTMRLNNSPSCVAEIVTIRKGYVLLFVLSSPDAGGIEELVQTMNSLHFLEDSD